MVRDVDGHGRGDRRAEARFCSSCIPEALRGPGVAASDGAGRLPRLPSAAAPPPAVPRPPHRSRASSSRAGISRPCPAEEIEQALRDAGARAGRPRSRSATRRRPRARPMTGPPGSSAGPSTRRTTAISCSRREAIRHFALERLVVVVTGIAAAQDGRDAGRPSATGSPRPRSPGVPGVELSRYELDRPGPSYTVDTARWADAPVRRRRRLRRRRRRVRELPRPGTTRTAVLEARPARRRDAAGLPARDGSKRCSRRLAAPERVELFDIPAVPGRRRPRSARGSRGGADRRARPARRWPSSIAELGLYRHGIGLTRVRSASLP